MLEPESKNQKLNTPAPIGSGSKFFWLPELDGLRALAFILVYYHHTIGLFWRDTPGNTPFYATLINLDLRIHNWGWIGVDLFFALSAFLITSLLLVEKFTNSAHTVDLGKFMMRRVLRIWPLYFFYLVLVTLSSLVLPAVYTGCRLGSGGALVQLVAFACFFGNFAVISQGVVLHLLNPMWSLCIEEQFYLAWGSAMKWIKNQRLIVALLFGFVLAAPALRYYLWLIDAKNYLSYYLNSLTHCDAIIYGALAAFFWRQFGERLKVSITAQSCLVLASLLFLSPVAFAPYIEASDCSIIWIMSSIGFGFTCLILATLSNRLLRLFFALPFLRHIGKLTYGLYMFHFLVIYSLVYIGRNNLHITSRLTFILISWPLGLCLTYLLARLSWKFIESPSLALKERFRVKSPRAEIKSA